MRKILSKISQNKATMIISFIIGIIGYAYIMIFRTPAVLEIIALIFFALVIYFSSACFFTEENTSEKDYKYKLPKTI